MVMKVETLVLLLILGKLIQFSTIESNVCCRLIIYGLYYVEVDSFYAHFWKRFNHKWVVNFVKGFFCIYSDYQMISIFQFVDTVYYIDGEFLNLWNKPSLIMAYELFDVTEFCMLKFLLRILHLCSSVILACNFLFLCCLCLVLLSGWLWPCRRSL